LLLVEKVYALHAIPIVLNLGHFVSSIARILCHDPNEPTLIDNPISSLRTTRFRPSVTFPHVLGETFFSRWEIQMRLVKHILLAGCLSLNITPVLAEVREAQFLSNVLLFSDESFAPGSAHLCQPGTGDNALIINVVTRVEALKGLNAAKVKITSGKCAGETGWVAIAFLNALV
jgi:hypothetical protein